MAVLRPLATISRSLGVGRLGDAAATALGRDPNAQPGGELSLTERPDPVPGDFNIDPGASDPNPSRSGSSITLRKPSPTNRLRVAVIGDSLAEGLANALARELSPTLVQVAEQGRLSTGLTRPDYFDWATGAAQIAERFRPDIVVVVIGSNDDQPIVYPHGHAVGGGTPEWGDAYNQEITEVLDAATRRGALVAWVSLPPMADEHLDFIARNLNNNYRSQVEGRDDAAFVDITDAISGSNGKYQAYGRDRSGKLTQLRLGDGVHFTPAGYDIVADDLIDFMEKNWGLTPRVRD